VQYDDQLGSNVLNQIRSLPFWRDFENRVAVGQRHFDHIAESSLHVIPSVARNLSRVWEALRSAQSDEA
jgi:hypothetical protein